MFTRDGERVKDFRKAWANVCAAAGVPRLLFHDLRRTGARNLRREGVAEGVIMRIGGWKTRNVFDRYNIVDQADLAEAARRLDAKRENQEFGHSLATIETAEKESERCSECTIATDSIVYRIARVAKLADARDLKSRVPKGTYRFDSDPGHHTQPIPGMHPARWHCERRPP